MSNQVYWSKKIWLYAVCEVVLITYTEVSQGINSGVHMLRPPLWFSSALSNLKEISVSVRVKSSTGNTRVGGKAWFISIFLRENTILALTEHSQSFQYFRLMNSISRMCVTTARDAVIASQPSHQVHSG